MKAMKILSSMQSSNRNAYFNEISILKKLNSEYIIKYFDNFELEKFSFCIITEYCQVYNFVNQKN